ncbi:GMC family oxidoreductase N-terminal domain-containing protein [Pseudomonas putida]|uniref:Choline dehydrogenase n=1 Tax=Pseudomonas parafulva TaxID=157782 RepID=A0AAJ0LJF3_9PSED|nr:MULTISPECIES: GMC family oxidoreductase N-terminal domain-containing protein [Pseudomonas]KTT17428.1 choline dehydrogenase [Pseudomonas parafulva]MBF8651125.1 GMC family oxidoreductase N-terminal domain-containing protein [Pseudomonas putida]MBF8655185.1 GMC family oxidoreductase N-terminal domain-containing protein [Pseudomonas putida]MBF8678952.1 GMC family oxidoreductase N-terminal domain-containing protein [Pseudomonas fulva]MBF8692659.1 GMC family oxidoreductase N-terminal domain-conta
MSSVDSAYDYVIVGAGPAGCLLANRLSADPSCRVLLLEAGGRDNYPWIHVPVGYLYCIGNPRTDWCFKTEAQPGLQGRSLGYPRGKVLGGCSSINGMIYMRGQAADYDHWASLGNRGWAWKDVLPLFKQSESHHGGASEHHGSSGEWRVERQRYSWPILDAFRDAAEQTGITKVDDFNTGDNEGCGYFQVNQRSGVRWNASKAFLRPIKHRPNLSVLTDVQVDQVLLSNTRARAVKAYWQGSWHEFSARREIVLCAGAVGSPGILQRSGIGPQQLLEGLGIGVRHSVPGVGSNLQDHLQLRLIYQIGNARTLNQMANSLWGKMGMGLRYLYDRSGPLAMAPSQLGAFVRSSPDQATANLQYHVQPLSLERFGEPLHQFPAFTASVCNLRPLSRGRIDIRSADMHSAPLIDPNYLSDPQDLRVAADAIRLTRRIVQAPALAAFAPKEYLPGPALQTEEQLHEAAGKIGTTIFHPVGTCRMGNGPMDVVDDQLRVHGIPGLRVADASIMPQITSGNTCSPTLMIAEKAAQLILKGVATTTFLNQDAVPTP